MEWTNDKTIDFIDDYHSSPELWDNKIAAYKNNKIKNGRLKALSEKYSCTVLELKKKIKNLRSAFHREHKKLNEKKGGSSTKKCKWFAYELLTFLLDVDMLKSTSSTAGSCEEDSEVAHSEDAESVNDEHPPSQLSVQSSCASASRPLPNFFKSPQKAKRKRRVEDQRPGEACATLKNASKRDDSYVFGEYVASKHRKYTSYTKNAVEHAINTILYDADMGKYDDPRSIYR